jgi:hypothetical protein
MVYSLRAQKKTTIGLEITVIMAVQDIKIFKMRKHTYAHTITHDFKLMREPEYGYPLILFMMSQIRVNVGVGGIDR